MKYPKILGLAALAASALMVFAGAGTASASVFCHSTTTPCAQKWSTGTEIDFTLQGTAEWKTTGGTIFKTCTGGTIRGPLINSGGASETVKVSISKSDFVWNGCTANTSTNEGGELEIHSISGSDSASVTIKGFSFTTNTIFGSCNYGFPNWTSFATLAGSATGNASINITTILSLKSGPACPADIEWVEAFAQTEPSGTGLFVEPS